MILSNNNLFINEPVQKLTCRKKYVSKNKCPKINLSKNQHVQKEPYQKMTVSKNNLFKNELIQIHIILLIIEPVQKQTC